MNFQVMNDNPGDILIKHPPIEQFGHKKSCLRRACFNSCGLLIFVLVGSLLFLKFAARAPEKTLSILPTYIQTEVPLYDPTQISSITLNPGIERQKKVELLAFFPKLFVSPFVVHFPHIFFPDAPKELTTKKELFYAFMRRPLIEDKDVYTLISNNLSAEPDFMSEYYTTELEKKGFKKIAEKKEAVAKIFVYEKDHTLVEVSVEDKNTQKIGTDRILVTISINASKP